MLLSQRCPIQKSAYCMTIYFTFWKRKTMEMENKSAFVRGWEWLITKGTHKDYFKLMTLYCTALGRRNLTTHFVKTQSIVHHRVQLSCACVCMLSRVWLCSSMECSLPGSSVHRISQARILERLAIPFSSGSSWSRGQTCISCIGRQILYHWATWVIYAFFNESILERMHTVTDEFNCIINIW